MKSSAVVQENNHISKKDFNDFLLKEYDNIAQAHFNTKQTLTAFFRYYLLIIALPAPFSAFILTRLSEQNTLGFLANITSNVSLLIFFIGLLVCSTSPIYR